MAAHFRLWSLQEFKLLDAMTESREQLVEKMTRMLEIKRGLQDFRQCGLVEAGRRKIRIIGPVRLRVVS